MQRGIQDWKCDMTVRFRDANISKFSKTTVQRWNQPKPGNIRANRGTEKTWEFFHQNRSSLKFNLACNWFLMDGGIMTCNIEETVAAMQSGFSSDGTSSDAPYYHWGPCTCTWLQSGMRRPKPLHSGRSSTSRSSLPSVQSLPRLPPIMPPMTTCSSLHKMRVASFARQPTGSSPGHKVPAGRRSLGSESVQKFSFHCPSTEKGLLCISSITRPCLQMHASLWSAVHDWIRS